MNPYKDVPILLLQNTNAETENYQANISAL